MGLFGKSKEEKHVEAEENIAEGRRLFEEGKHVEAGNFIVKAINLENNNPDYWAAQSRNQISSIHAGDYSNLSVDSFKGDCELTYQSSKDALKNNPNHLGALNCQAEILHMMGKKVDSAKIYDKIIALDDVGQSDRALAYCDKASLLIDEDDWNMVNNPNAILETALTCVDAALAIESDNDRYIKAKETVMRVIEHVNDLKQKKSNL